MMAQVILSLVQHEHLLTDCPTVALRKVATQNNCRLGCMSAATVSLLEKLLFCQHFSVILYCYLLYLRFLEKVVGLTLLEPSGLAV